MLPRQKELEQQSEKRAIPHLLTVDAGDVVVLVIDVIEQHQRVDPFDVHRQVALRLVELLRCVFYLATTKKEYLPKNKKRHL